MRSLSTVSMTPQAQSRPPHKPGLQTRQLLNGHTHYRRNRLLLVRFAQKGWDAIDKVVQSFNSE